MGKIDDPFASSSDEEIEHEDEISSIDSEHKKKNKKQANARNVGKSRAANAPSTSTSRVSVEQVPTQDLASSLDSPLPNQTPTTPATKSTLILTDIHVISTEFLPENFDVIENNIVLKGASDRVEKDNDFYSNCSCQPRKDICSSVASNSSSRRRSRGTSQQQPDATTTSTSTVTLEETAMDVDEVDGATPSPRATVTDPEVLTCYNDHCDNIRALTECVDCPTINCQNNRFQEKRFKKLEVRDTKKKGYGIFAREKIRKNDLMMEFVGEVIPSHTMKQRISKAEEEGDHHMYYMEIVKGSFLDARYKGGIARYTNHSCDPNARLEKWIVCGRYRLGIFASRDIEENEEITFDYQWKPSMKHPTKCYCMSPKCRGYLEVFANEEEKELYIRSGYWVKGSDRNYRGGIDNAFSLYDEQTGQLVPDRLVGKYVKILRGANDFSLDSNGVVFDELKVKSYKRSAGVYVCYSLQDQQEIEEVFSIDALGNNTIGTWYWLDQHRSGSIIKKLDIALDDSIPLVKKEENSGTQSAKEWGATSNNTSGKLTNISTSFKSNRVSIRTTVKFRVAKYLLDQRGIQPMFPDNQSLADTFAKHIYEQYKVHAFAVKNSIDNNGSNSATINNGLREKTTFELVLEGEPETVSEIKSWIRNAADIVKIKDNEESEALTLSMKQRQSLLMVHDWRCIPKVACSSQFDGDKIMLAIGKVQLSRWHCERLQQLATVTSSTSTVLPISSSPSSSAAQSGLLEVQSLPTLLLGVPPPTTTSLSSSASTTPSSADAEQQVKVYYNLSNYSDQQKLLNHLLTICKQPNCKLTSFEKLYAFELLIRCIVRMSSSGSSTNSAIGSDAMWNNNKEMTITLAAILILTSKYNNNFKPKHMLKIIRICYCQVNNRNEKDMNGMNIEYLYFQQILQREQDIALKLDMDFYIPNVENLWLSPVLNPAVVSALTASATAALASSSSSSSSSSVGTSIAGMEKIIQTVNQWKSLYDQATTLLIHLSSQSHLLLLPFPVEYLQVAMMFVVIGLEITMEFAFHKGDGSVGHDANSDFYRVPSESEVLFTFPPSSNPTKRGTIVYAGMHKLLAERQLYWNQLTDTASTKFNLCYREVAFIIRYLLKLMMFHSSLLISAHKAFQTLTIPSASATSSSLPMSNALTNQDVLDDVDLMFHVLEFATMTGVYHHYTKNSYVIDVPTNGSIVANNIPCSWPLKTRLNPLFYPAPSSISIGSNASNEQDLLAIDEDCYQGRLDSNVTNHLGLSHWSVDDDNVCRSNIGIPFSMRSIPNNKIARREVAKMQQILATTVTSSTNPASGSVNTLDNAGVFHSLLFEMRLFEHLHYFQRRLSSNSSSPVSLKVQRSPYFMEPVAFAKLDLSLQGPSGKASEVDKLYDLSTSSTNGSGIVPTLSSSTKRLSIEDPLLKHVIFANDLLPLSYLLDQASNYPVTFGSTAAAASAPTSSYSLSPFLAWQWCLDLLVAADHLQYCGIGLKWLGEEYLSISSKGRLMITNLQGAELLEASTEELQKLRDQLTALSASSIAGRNDSNGHHKSKHSKEDKHRDKDRESKDKEKDKKHHKHEKKEKDQKEKDKHGEKEKDKEKDKEKEKVHIPSSVLNFTAPEIICGGEVSYHSTVYVVGMVACWILTGKHLIKNGKTEQKQVDYLYKVLGTPKMLGYKNFDSLPLSDVYGKYIQNENGTVSESRSRISKTARSLFSEDLIRLFSFGSVPIKSGTDNAAASIYDPELNDGGGVVDFIVSCTQLIPEKRLTPSSILKLAFFSKLSPVCSRELQMQRLVTATSTMPNKARCISMSTQSRLNLLLDYINLNKQDSVLKHRQMAWLSLLIANGESFEEEQQDSGPQPPPPPPVPVGPPPLQAALSSPILSELPSIRENQVQSSRPYNGTGSFGASSVQPPPPPPPPAGAPPTQAVGKSRFSDDPAAAVSRFSDASSATSGVKRPLDNTNENPSRDEGFSRGRDSRDRERDNRGSSSYQRRDDNSRDRRPDSRDRDRDHRNDRDRDNYRDRSRSRDRRPDPYYDYDSKKPRSTSDRQGYRW